MKSTKLIHMIFLAAIVMALFVPLVHAEIPTMSETLSQIGVFIADTLGFESITDHSREGIGALMRIAVWLLVFSVLYFVARQIFPAGGLQRNAAITVAVVIATISTIFLPVDLLLGVGEVYATTIAFVLFAIPLGGMGYLYAITWHHATRYWIALRIFVLLLFYLLLSIITTAVSGGI